MKTLKLSDERALELYKNADESFKSLLKENFGEDFFKPKNIYDKVYDLVTLEQYLNEDIIPFKRPKNSFEKYLNACAIIPKIVSVYNGGTELDWKNTSIYKYLPYFKLVGSSWVFLFASSWYDSASGSASYHYKSSLLCEKGVENFKQYYLDFYSYKG